MRVTTKMMIKNYQTNLNTAVSNMTEAQKKVLTQRNFNSVKEDPLAAARASSLERQYAKTTDYIDMVKELDARQDAQEDAIRQVKECAELISKDNGLRALNGTNFAQRDIFAQSIRGYQQSMLLSLNSKYSDEYVLGGSASTKAPFEMKDDGTLTYRGIDVNDSAALEAANYTTKDHIYIDLGFGLGFDDTDQVIPTSAYDKALPGINATGHGTATTSNGDTISKNIVVLAGQLADELEKEPFDNDKFCEMLTVFDDGMQNLINTNTNIGTKSQFLSSTADRLEDSQLNLAEQIDDLVNANMPMAITNYSYSQYAYNQALKVGTNILSQSFLDFMR